MTDEELAQFISLGHELPGTEFKGPGARNDRAFMARVTRAVLGMANRRDGGHVIIGVEEELSSLRPVGLSEEQFGTWQYDDVADIVNSYADPGVVLRFEVRHHQGVRLVVLRVEEFLDVPVVCKKDYPHILRAGAIYVRSRRKPETTEVPSQTEMRELIDLAAEKRLRSFVAAARATGFLVPASEGVRAAPPEDKELYERQLGGL